MMTQTIAHTCGCKQEHHFDARNPARLADGTAPDEAGATRLAEEHFARLATQPCTYHESGPYAHCDECGTDSTLSPDLYFCLAGYQTTDGYPGNCICEDCYVRLFGHAPQKSQEDTSAIVEAAA